MRMYFVFVLAMMGLTACSTTETKPDDGKGIIPQTVLNSENANRARIRIDLAANYYQSGAYQVALEEIRQAIEIEPALPASYGLLGLIYMQLNDNARAGESFQRALKLAPQDSDLNNNYGWFLCQSGKPREAVAHFLTAVRNPLYPTPSKPLHNAGICATRAGDGAAAEGYFQRSFQLDPTNPVAMFHLAEINLRRNDPERAQFFVLRLVKSYEVSPEVLWLAVRTERKLGDQRAQQNYANQLRRTFPAANETNLLMQGKYD
jgi:type IV pilus assembly protein PilF